MAATQIEDGGPAFPVTIREGTLDCAMTLRDYFAAKAVSYYLNADASDASIRRVLGLGDSDPFPMNLNEVYSAKKAYQLADAMLAARRSQ